MTKPHLRQGLSKTSAQAIQNAFVFSVLSPGWIVTAALAENAMVKNDAHNRLADKRSNRWKNQCDTYPKVIEARNTTGYRRDESESECEFENHIPFANPQGIFERDHCESRPYQRGSSPVRWSDSAEEPHVLSVRRS